MSRMLAAKASLATRVDALGEDGSFDLGAEHKAKLEARLRILEEGNLRRISGTGKAKAKFEKYHGASEVKQYPAAADSTMASSKRRHSQIEEKKPLIEEIEPVDDTVAEVPRKKKKSRDSIGVQEEEASAVKSESETPGSSKKKKKMKQEAEAAAAAEVAEPEQEAEVTESGKKKKQKKPKVKAELVEQVESTSAEQVQEGPSSEKKKKKKKKAIPADE